MGEPCRVSIMSRARFRLHVKWRWVSFQVPHKQRRPKRDFLIFYPSTKPDSLFKEARVDWLLSSREWQFSAFVGGAVEGATVTSSSGKTAM